MGALGWVEGRNFTLVPRYGDGRTARLPEIAAELVQQRVDLILVGSSPGALAAKRATSTIPIVVVTTGDPVADGIVTSLARPGINVTGVTALGQALDVKRLELIKEVVPGASRVAVLLSPIDLHTAPLVRETQRVGRGLAFEVALFDARDAEGLEAAFARMHSERISALLVQTSALYITHRKRIVELAAKTGIPAVFGERLFIDAGGLMFYGASLRDMHSDAAVYADKILKGARPGDLPIAQPTKLELVINSKTAKALGINFPASVLARADVVVDK